MIKEERRKKKKRKNILQVILGILIVLALAVLIIFTVFKVKNVEVEGNKLYDAKVIEKAVLTHLPEQTGGHHHPQPRC